jgi:CheY-like chemotaxis protein
MPTVGFLSILMADDDEDDCLLASSAFEEAGMAGELRLFADGKELMEYLHGQCSFSDPESHSLPDLILLDLNMPQKDGREALREIKSDHSLKNIPTVILTTSSETRDIELCEKLGAVAFITKPVDFEEWVKIMASLAIHAPDKGSPARC